MTVANLMPKTRGEIFQEFGRVILMEQQTFVVRTESGDFTAKKAAGCLLTPGLDDLVLLAGGPGPGYYILSVLEREPGACSRIGLTGDLELSVERGSLKLKAEEGIDLKAGRDLSIGALGLTAHLARAEVVAPVCSLWGTLFQVNADRIKILARTIDSVAARVFERFTRSYRVVEDAETVRAGRLDMKAEKNLSLRGQNALVTAEELVKLDGDQIHLG